MKLNDLQNLIKQELKVIQGGWEKDWKREQEEWFNNSAPRMIRSARQTFFNLAQRIGTRYNSRPRIYNTPTAANNYGEAFFGEVYIEGIQFSFVYSTGAGARTDWFIRSETEDGYGGETLLPLPASTQKIHRFMVSETRLSYNPDDLSDEITEPDKPSSIKKPGNRWTQLASELELDDEIARRPTKKKKKAGKDSRFDLELDESRRVVREVLRNRL